MLSRDPSRGQTNWDTGNVLAVLTTEAISWFSLQSYKRNSSTVSEPEFDVIISIHSLHE